MFVAVTLTLALSRRWRGTPCSDPLLVPGPADQVVEDGDGRAVLYGGPVVATDYGIGPPPLVHDLPHVHYGSDPDTPSARDDQRRPAGVILLDLDGLPAGSGDEFDQGLSSFGES